MRPRLFFRVAANEVRTRLSYRVDFWIGSVGQVCVRFAIAYFVWKAVFLESGRAAIGGLGFPGMVRYYVAVILIAKVVRGREFSEHVSDDIYLGGLTKYLLFPVPYLRFKYAQAVGAMAPIVVEIAGFFVLASFALPALGARGAFSLDAIALALAATLVASLLYFEMSVAIQSVAFWADNVWSLQNALRTATGLLGGLLLPLSVFPAWAQHALDLLPFRYLYSFAAESLLGGVSLAAWLEGMGVALFWCVLFGFLARAVFRRGLRTYTGVGI